MAHDDAVQYAGELLSYAQKTERAIAQELAWMRASLQEGQIALKKVEEAAQWVVTHAEAMGQEQRRTAEASVQAQRLHGQLRLWDGVTLTAMLNAEQRTTTLSDVASFPAGEEDPGWVLTPSLDALRAQFAEWDAHVRRERLEATPSANVVDQKRWDQEAVPIPLYDRVREAVEAQLEAQAQKSQETDVTPAEPVRRTEPARRVEDN